MIKERASSRVKWLLNQLILSLHFVVHGFNVEITSLHPKFHLLCLVVHFLHAPFVLICKPAYYRLSFILDPSNGGIESKDGKVKGHGIIANLFLFPKWFQNKLLSPYFPAQGQPQFPIFPVQSLQFFASTPSKSFCN